MRTVAMCFSMLQVPRCRIHTLASSWWENFRSLSRTGGNSSSFKLLGSNTYGHEGGHSRRWTRRPISTKTEGKNKNTLSSKTSSIRHEISDGKFSSSTKLGINKSEISEFQRIQYCDIQQKIAENKDLASLVTVIIFDIETTGFSRENERIIEIALQDLLGGENSTFQTLVNPERYVPNPHIHGISTHMVNRPDVPRYHIL
uniref:Exonuclease domain-containing protein n=1 Tax=Davidia involucrata TaxID=16924 RepID=A0A5B7BM82_DAVIN